MARHKRKQQPHDPAKGQAERDARALQSMLDAKVREREPARWGDERPGKDRIASLKSQGVDVELDFRGRVKSATKMDVWAQMHAQAVKVAASAGRTASLTDEQYAAVRRLEGDMIARMGHGAAGWNLDRYDRQGDGAAITDRMVDAGARVDDALALVGPPSCRILLALVGPNAETNGRRLVRRCTQRDFAQAFDNYLAARYGDADGKPVKRITCDTLNDVHARKCEACGSDLPGGAEGIESILVSDDWRDIVERITGETNAMAQSAALRLAAQSLADVYPIVEDREKDRRSSAPYRAAVA